MFNQSVLAEESALNTAKPASGSTRALNCIQKYAKAMRVALIHREESLSKISPQLILRIRIRGGIRSFQLSKLPAPLRVAYSSGDLELDYLSHLESSSIDGIACKGADVIQQVLEELEQNGIDLECFSICFVPTCPEEFTIMPQLL